MLKLTNAADFGGFFMPICILFIIGTKIMLLICLKKYMSFYGF